MTGISSATHHLLHVGPFSSRAHDPSGLRQGSGPLAASNTGSPRFTHSLSNLSNLIGCERQSEYSAHVQKLGAARGLDPWRSPEGSWTLGTRMTLAMFVMSRHALGTGHTRFPPLTGNFLQPKWSLIYFDYFSRKHKRASCFE